MAPLVGLFYDVSGDPLRAEPEGDRRREGDGPQHDQERRGRQLHRDPELRYGGERRVDDYGVADDARQQVAPGGPLTSPARKFARSAARIRIRIAAITLGM